MDQDSQPGGWGGGWVHEGGPGGKEPGGTKGKEIYWDINGYYSRSMFPTSFSFLRSLVREEGPSGDGIVGIGVDADQGDAEFTSIVRVV